MRPLARPFEEIGAAAWLLARAGQGMAMDTVEGDPLGRRRLATAIITFVWRPLPTLCSLAVLAGLIVGLSAGKLLSLYNAELAVLPVLARVLVRDVAPLLVGVFAAGRISVALAARLAGMRLRREVEALEALGVDPARYVLSPTLAAVMLAAPVHAAAAAGIALLGAGVALRLDAVTPSSRFLALVLTDETARAALVGMAKALLFSLIAAGVGSAAGSRERLDATGSQATAAFTAGLLSVFAAAALWTALS